MNSKTVTMTLHEFKKVETSTASILGVIKRTLSVIEDESRMKNFNHGRVESILKESINYLQVLENFGNE